MFDINGWELLLLGLLAILVLGPERLPEEAPEPPGDASHPRPQSTIGRV